METPASDALLSQVDHLIYGTPGLRAEHPEPEVTRDTLRSLGPNLLVGEGDTPALIATVDTPRGTVELR